jgi:photosystem II stability/assembly factor-like uncharacterized protein
LNDEIMARPLRWPLSATERQRRKILEYIRPGKVVHAVGPVIAIFALVILALASASRARADGYIALQENAIPVHDPAHALLISIARAGERLVAVGGHGVIVYSDDNGASWRQAAVPVQSTITAAAFADANIGWAVGAFGLILHTVDGGKTWQKQLTGDAINKLMVQSAAQYLAANPNDPLAARAVHRSQILSAQGEVFPLLAILVASPEQATMFGGYRICVRTMDGGKTWADCSLKVMDPISHNQYGVLSTADGIYLVGEAGDISKYSPKADQFDLLTSPTTTTLFGIIATKPSNLLAYGVAGNLFRSTDHGKTWASISVPDGGCDLTGGTVLGDGKIVLASECGGVYLSLDDGQSFQSASLILGMALFDVTTAANGNLVFVGAQGVRLVPESALVVPEG